MLLLLHWMEMDPVERAVEICSRSHTRSVRELLFRYEWSGFKVKPLSAPQD